MQSVIEIQPVTGRVHGTIQPPGSKSITNRVLLIAALADGTSVLRGALESDDTRVMVESLKRLGIDVTLEPTSHTITVVGCAGRFPNSSSDLLVENSGTTIRFLTAALGLAGGNFRLDGVSRMRERPIGPLVDSLNSLGAQVSTESPNQCPPVVIQSGQLAGGVVKIRGDLSSQYLSGLLMAAPLASSGLTIQIEGPLISKPYVQMTIEVMNSFGVRVVANENFDCFQIPAGQTYSALDYAIEPDASAASYFWAAAAICGGTARVRGLNLNALQGDVGFVRCLELMGCTVETASDSISVVGPARHGIEIDMSDVSDTVQTLAAVALFVDGPTTVRNIAHNRIKETDRIGNLAIELRKLGATVDDFPDGLTIQPGELRAAEIETYDDHRMAMSLALVGLRQSGVKILNPGCVSKTYPEYFADLQMFCGAVT
jgi:3-phosphoshikimate 1-carboxyvinyltransferase